MYITSLKMTGLETIEFPVTSALPSDPYIIKDADGLGPSEVDVSIINTLNAGGYYQGRKTHLKEIVLRVGLNPDYAADENVSLLRESLYGMLTPGGNDYVKLEVMDFDIPLAYITGHIKKFEITPFSATPEVQMTIACTQQYWLKPSPISVDLVELDLYEPVITNEGTAPSGFKMELTFTEAVSGWTLFTSYNTKMFFNYAFQTGDILRFNTQPGERGIWLLRPSMPELNIIYVLSPDSTWIMLNGGDNELTTSNQDFTWTDISYTPKYWGI